MKNLYLTLITVVLAPVLSVAQFTYPVNVVNNEYQPSSITISQGDAISWECSEGFHSVDGTLDTYPENPEGFSSGNAETAPWTYTFTFTEEGVYNYQCVIHQEEMTGTVVVEGKVTGVSEENTAPMRVYPNPTEDFIFVDEIAENIGEVRFTLFDISGKKVLERTLIGQKRIDISEMNSGIYLYQIFSDQELIQTGKLVRK